VFAAAFGVDAAQHALVVRPVTALARAVRAADESGVDGAVVGTARGVGGAGRLAAAAHRGSLPRAFTAVLTGAIVLGLAAAMVEVFS
jgi:NADH-quinone oxidoreductase subunit L